MPTRSISPRRSSRCSTEPRIEFIGEIGEREKAEFLGNAAALLFPIDWPEPFGLVMIEAIACGTPVIACRHGSVPEVVEDGVTGFIVDDEVGALSAIERLDRLDRARIRGEFERRFTSRRMAEDYLAIYRLLSQPPVSRLANRVSFCRCSIRMPATQPPRPKPLARSTSPPSLQRAPVSAAR